MECGITPYPPACPAGRSPQPPLNNTPCATNEGAMDVYVGGMDVYVESDSESDEDR